jgi:hypothetical protein
MREVSDKSSTNTWRGYRRLPARTFLQERPHSRSSSANINAVILMMGLVASSPAWANCNIVNGKKYGDCTGVSVNTSPKPHQTIADNVDESGIIAGATVKFGGVLTLSGVSEGGIEVHRGGRLVISGVVNGSVSNEGGFVEIEGVVNGDVVSHAGYVSVSGVVQGRLLDGGSGTKYRREHGAVIDGMPVP